MASSFTRWSTPRLSEIPRRNKREKNAPPREGAIPTEWGKDEHKPARKDTGARRAKKNNTNYCGHKNRANTGQERKPIQRYSVTDAAAHDSRVFGELPDRTPDENGNKRPVYAGSAHRSKATEKKPAQNGVTGRIRGKGTRAAALTGERKEANKQTNKKEAGGAGAGRACVRRAGYDMIRPAQPPGRDAGPKRSWPGARMAGQARPQWRNAAKCGGNRPG